MTPEERAAKIQLRNESGPIVRLLLYGPSSGAPDMKMLCADIAQAIREAVAEEREACAKVAETWADEWVPTGETGCVSAYNESLECTATSGIAEAIRARLGT